MSEPEAAVDVAMVRAALDEAASNPDRSIAGSQYAVLGHYRLPKVLAALEQANARAERLAAALREARGNCELDRDSFRRLRDSVSQAAADQFEDIRDRIDAALAVDAPGRGD